MLTETALRTNQRFAILSAAMATRCRKCGGTRWMPAARGLLQQLAKASGYHLLECCACRRYRLSPRRAKKTPASDLEASRGQSPISESAAVAPPEPPSAIDVSEERELKATTPSKSAKAGALSNRCPNCGSKNYRRSQRTKMERLLKKPAMARCRECRARFPLPRTHDDQ